MIPMAHPIAGQRDPDILHHAPVLMIKDVAVQHKVTYLAFITGAHEDAIARLDEQGVLPDPLKVEILGIWRQARLLLPAESGHVVDGRMQGNRISDLGEDFGEVCVLPSGPLDLDAQGAL